VRTVRSSAPPVALFALALGCGSAAKEPHMEYGARELAPVPACVTTLQARREKTGLVRSTSEQGYWRLVFPNFDTEKQALPEDAIACTGRNLLADPAFQGGEWIRHYPLAVEEGEILLGSGGNSLKALWLRTHKFADGTEAGPLALVRTKEDSAEVYAVGVYRGQTKRPYFGLERIGPEVVVSVSDEGCTGNTKREPCLSVTTLFLPRRGELVRMTAFATDRRDYVDRGEPGSPDRIEYRLTSTAKYAAEGVDVFEEITAKDTMGRELRRAELERKFIVRDTELVPSEGSLWPRIFPRQSKSVEPPIKSAISGAGVSGATDGGARANELVPKFSCCEDGVPTLPAPPSAPDMSAPSPTLPGAPSAPSGPSMPSFGH
jgi:hypothetical protein